MSRIYEKREWIMAEINKSIVKVEDLRITKLRTYLLLIIDVLVTNKKYQINANMLSNELNNYSLDKIHIL